jgi:serine/threonine protein kinase
MMIHKLIQRQTDSWNAGRRIQIEALVDGMSEASKTDTQSAENADTQFTMAEEHWLELICNEVALRCAIGESPSLAEYQARFPNLATSLKIQWEIDQLLDLEHGLPSREVAPQQWISASTETEPDQRRYELRTELGRGSAGVVYEAWDHRLKRLIAIKRLRSGFDASVEELKRIRREAEAFAKLHHPNIVQVYDSGLIDGLPFVSMELCKGGSLAKRLESGALPIRIAVEIVKDIASGIAEAHRCRIIHRDLKPANILLKDDQSNHAKVADFGLAKLLDTDRAATATGDVIGTPAYMAPEQAFGDAKYAGPASDIYSIGAILYECLTGQPPFRGSNIAQILDQVRNHDAISLRRLRPKVPRDLETITMVCLRKEPFNRYRTANDLVEDLSRFLRSDPILAKQESWSFRTGRIVMKNPVTSIFAALAFSLLMMISAGSIVFARKINVERIAAVEAKQESIRQRDAALRARNLTREALDAMTSSLATSSLEEQHEISPVQRSFLKQVLSYYTEVVDDPSDDLTSAERTASAAERVAWIHDQLGNKQEACKSYSLAAKRVELLISRHPENTSFKKRYASILQNLGCGLSRVGEQQAAVEAFQKSLEVQRSFNEAGPGQMEERIQLGKVLHNLALQLRDQGKYSETKQTLVDSLIAFEDVEKQFDATDSVRREIASVKASLGLHEATRGSWTDGKDYLNSSIKSLTKLAEDNPYDRLSKGLLGWCLLNFGIQLSDHNELDSAKHSFERSVHVLKELTSQFPTIAIYQQDYCSALIMFSMHLINQKQLDQAYDFALQAKEIASRFLESTPDSRDFRWVLGDALHALAKIHRQREQISEAQREYQALMETWMHIENHQSGSSEFYDSKLSEFQEVAAFTSGFLPSHLSAYWDLSMKLLTRQHSKRNDGVSKRDAFMLLAHDRTKGFLTRNAIDEAVDFSDGLEDPHDVSPRVWYNLACIHGIISNHPKASESVRTSQVDKAWHCLRLAIEHGWSDQTYTAKDPDLAALQERGDFKKWLLERSANKDGQN